MAYSTAQVAPASLAVAQPSMRHPRSQSASRREVQREDVLAPHDPAGVGEAVAQVEPARRAGAVRAAGVEHVGAGPGPQVVHDRVERGGAVASALEPVVDEQLPQEVRADEVVVHRLRDVVADHRESDQRAGLSVVHRPWVGHSALLIAGLGEDLLHRVEVLVLAGAAAQAHDHGTVPRVHDVAQPDPGHRRLLDVLAHVYSPAAPGRKYRVWLEEADTTEMAPMRCAAPPVPRRYSTRAQTRR